MSVSTRTPRTARRREWSPDADLVGHYLSEVGTTPLLTAEQEVDLSRRIEAGVYAAELLRRAEAGESPPLETERRRALRAVAHDGRVAKDHMIRANLRLVVSVAKKHAFRGLPLGDVIQEGNLGLIRAVEKFDYAKGYKFSTYATWWIRQAIERGLAEQTRTVRLPVHVVEELSKLGKIERKLRAELDREPTVEEVSQVSGTSVARIIELRDASRATLSLETPVGDDGSTSVADLIEDTTAEQAYDAVEQQAVAAELRALIRTLPDRQARIMSQRYGLADGRARTLQEVAEELGLTRERIRQLEKESLRLLRDPARHEALLAWAG
ncbi:sigma-70 family RNA polymerase sigma factor [Saccharothrix coeruleofusca]|uniref:RNA polymerase sigma factor n=1 Tax=Saccharothrix coeruleofusca TaxID=33919 RepID=A0A918ASK0_9PSEU|nr:sigma-70 family RNA polymerase sigma factor [Saccharothrix coeruleofusca]MBP2335428.1 RNA polymerase primary sigma factor/RNA polymerase nonessential primary-like sigma factor [Saccharothrix coeruleofusca]GGP77725.1 RNA polymerase principal sigma factor HrdC [Saccharothrix coeruleofusca]